jgi:hypothetical protein
MVRPVFKWTRWISNGNLYINNTSISAIKIMAMFFKIPPPTPVSRRVDVRQAAGR